MVRLDIGEGVGDDGAHGGAVHEDVGHVEARVGGDGEGLVGALGDGDGARGGDGAARPGAGQNLEGDGRCGFEYRVDGVVPVHVEECVGENGTDGNAVNLHIRRDEAGIGRDRKGLVVPFEDRNVAAG